MKTETVGVVGAGVIGVGVAQNLAQTGHFKTCFGHAVGPLETADLIGLDTILLTLEVLCESYGEEKFGPAPLLREMVAEGLLGQKSGEGFYPY